MNGAQRESSKSKDTPGATSTGPNKNNIEIDEQRNNPYFDKAASKNVTALLGKTAYLNCRVKNLGNKTVSLVVVGIFFIVYCYYYHKTNFAFFLP